EDHPTLFPRLLSLLPRGGVMAIQMPRMHAAPLRTLQQEVAANGPWASALAGVASVPAILEPETYWDLLRLHCRTLDIWETTYFHALRGEDAVAQWASGTSLRPYLDALPDGLRERYLQAYSQALRPVYPQRADGITLLPFRRLFILAET